MRKPFTSHDNCVINADLVDMKNLPFCTVPAFTDAISLIPLSTVPFASVAPIDTRVNVAVGFGEFGAWFPNSDFPDSGYTLNLPPSFPYGCMWPFGISEISGPRVTICSGAVRLGSQIIISEPATVTITQPGQGIGWRLDPISGTISIIITDPGVAPITSPTQGSLYGMDLTSDLNAVVADVFNFGIPTSHASNLWDIFSITGTEVTIGLGGVRCADTLIMNGPFIPISISAPNQWLGWQYDPAVTGADALSVVGPFDGLPQNHDGLIVGPLYQFSYEITRTGTPLIMPIRRCEWSVIQLGLFQT